MSVGFAKAKRRVVVTGLGIVSPIGNNVKDSWDNLLAGKSGITRISRFDPQDEKLGIACHIAGEVKGLFTQVGAQVAPGGLLMEIAAA